MQWQASGKPMANPVANLLLLLIPRWGGFDNSDLVIEMEVSLFDMPPAGITCTRRFATGFATGLPLVCHWIATGLPLDGGHSGAGRTAPLRSVTRRANNSAFRSPRRRAPPAPPAPEALPACVKSTLSGHQGSKFGPSQGVRDTPRRTPMRHVRPRPTRMGHASADASEASLGEASTDRARLSGHQ